MRLAKCIPVCVLAWAVAILPATAGVLLQPYEAPDWSVTEWVNGDPGPLRNQRGRVMVIQFFQLWCPVSNEFALPLATQWHEQWADREDVMVVAIHSVFEGHDQQGPERLRRFIRENGITYPVGIDKHPQGERETPVTMDRFNTGGTPHLVIVDKEGDLRFSHFGRFDPYPIEAFVDRLTKEKGSGVMPGPRTRPTTQTTGRDDTVTTNRGNPRGNPPPRERGRGNPPAKSDPDEGGDPDEETHPLSGNYQMQFQQKTKSCGVRARPTNVPVQLTVDGDRLTARFQERFLGLNQLVAKFDPATGNFSTDTMRRSDDQGVGVTLNLELNGRFDLKANPPTLQFQFQLEKEGDEPGWECAITGLGSATRSRR